MAHTVCTRLPRSALVPLRIDRSRLRVPLYAVRSRSSVVGNRWQCLFSPHDPLHSGDPSLSYLRSTSRRERQQVRFFLVGIFLAFAPLLLLTVLPVVTANSEYAVDGQISSLFYFVLPLSLGYAVLRPQVLVYDTTIRRTITWIVGAISIGLLGYGSSSASQSHSQITFRLLCFMPGLGVQWFSHRASGGWHRLEPIGPFLKGRQRGAAGSST